MAFTEAEKLKICRITGVTSDRLEDVFTFRAVAITSAVETEVRELIAEWNAGVGRNNTSIEPKEANFGARINAGDAKRDIRNELATLLYLQEYMAVNGAGQTRLVRG